MVEKPDQMSAKMEEAFLNQLPMEERMRGISVEDRLRGIPIRERLQGVPAKDILLCLNEEQWHCVRQLLSEQRPGLAFDEATQRVESFRSVKPVQERTEIEHMNRIYEVFAAVLVNGLPVRERLKGIPTDERLQGIAAEERLLGLTEEDRARMRKVLIDNSPQIVAWEADPTVSENHADIATRDASRSTQKFEPPKEFEARFLRELSVEKRLRGISDEERLRGIPAEERLLGLREEERARLLKLLNDECVNTDSARNRLAPSS